MDHTIPYQVWGLDMEFNNFAIKQFQFILTPVQASQTLRPVFFNFRLLCACFVMLLRNTRGVHYLIHGFNVTMKKAVWQEPDLESILQIVTSLSVGGRGWRTILLEETVGETYTRMMSASMHTSYLRPITTKFIILLCCFTLVSYIHQNI